MKIKERIIRIFKSVFFRNTLSLTGISALGKSIGLFIPFFIALWFGAGSSMDAFFFSYGLVLFFTSLITSTLSPLVIPAIAELKSSNEEIGGFLGSLFMWSTIGFLCIVIFSLLLLGLSLPFITRFKTEYRSLVMIFYMEMFPLVLLLIYSSIIDGVLYAYKKFFLTGSLPVLRSLFVILFIFVFKEKLGAHAVSLGYCFGELVRFMLLLVYIKCTKLFTLRFTFRLNTRWKAFLKLTLFQGIALIIASINPIIDKSLASWVGDGAISVLSYADRLYAVFSVFTSSGVSIVLLSHLSNVFNRGEYTVFKRDVGRAVKAVGGFSLLLEAALIASAPVIVRLALDRGAFDKLLLEPVQLTFVFYSVGFIFNMIANVFLKAHIVMKNMKIILKNAILVFVLNVVFDVLLVKSMGTGGIALATSIANFAAALYLFLTLSRDLVKM